MVSRRWKSSRNKLRLFGNFEHVETQAGIGFTQLWFRRV